MIHEREPRDQNQASEYTLTPEQLTTLWNAATNSRDELVLKLLFWGALRAGDVAALDVRDVELRGTDSAVLHIHDGKGRVSGDVELAGDIVGTLRRYTVSHFGRYDAGPLIASAEYGPRYTRKAISVRSVQDIVARTARRAGIANPNPQRTQLNSHIFRHTWARAALAAGVPIPVVQRQLRHRSSATTIDCYGTPSAAETQRWVAFMVKQGGLTPPAAIT